MPASVNAAEKSSAPAEPQHVPSDHPKAQALDYSTLNALLENINNRLTGGLHGSFLERGSRLDEDKRYVQLPLFFELRDELDNMKKQAGKQAQRSEAEDEKQVIAAVKPSGGMVATVNRIVEQQLEPVLRDFRIKLDRLQDSVAKVEANVAAAAEAKKKTAGAQSKEPQQQSTTTTEVDAKIRTLTQKVNHQASSTAGMAADLLKLKDIVHKNGDLDTYEIGELKKRVKKLEDESGTLRNEVNTVQESLNQYEEPSDEDDGRSSEEDDDEESDDGYYHGYRHYGRYNGCGRR